MASLVGFSNICTASLLSSSSQAFIPTLSSPSIVSTYLSTKTSFGSFKSTFVQNGLSVFSTSFSSQFPDNLLKKTGVVYARASSEKSIHDFSVKDIDGKDVSLNKFKGKILLIVNVASRCGLTSSNYTELSHIYEKYKSQGWKNNLYKSVTVHTVKYQEHSHLLGLEILAFPCNQFGGQEPGSNTEIKKFACTRFKAEFPIFDKVDVNGPNTAPVYQFLKSSAGGFLGDLVKWNFEKFLVDKNGKVVERYPPTTSPFQIEKDIKRLLAA